MIPARVSLVTLGARDFRRLRDFYAGLGWRISSETDTFCAFDTGGAVLALFPFEMLAEDARLPAGEPQPRFRGYSLALNVERRELVDEAIGELRAAGARITKEPEDASWGGRSAYFADPEGNLWEVAWAPGTSFDERGALIFGG
jgi:uncharacterized protein